MVNATNGFVGTMWVTTDKGTYKLEDLVSGQMNVMPMGIDPYGRPDYKPIDGFFKHKQQPTIKFIYESAKHGHEIYCTYTQLLLTQEGFKAAGRVGYGDKLMTIRGRLDDRTKGVIRELVPVKIISITNGGTKQIYEVSVEENRSYTVNGIVVHN